LISLDLAVFRRLDFKVGFDHLKPEQAGPSRWGKQHFPLFAEAQEMKPQQHFPYRKGVD
jgi:hypothetical protein